MGPLVVPPRAMVYFDAQIAIYSVEQHPKYSPALVEFWRRVQTFEIFSLTSELSHHECLVHPFRDKDAARVQRFDDFFTRPNIQNCMVTRTALRRAAQWRAEQPRLRTPDAIHFATAIEWQAGFFLTNDRGFHGLSGPNVLILDDLIAPTATP